MITIQSDVFRVLPLVMLTIGLFSGMVFFIEGWSIKSGWKVKLGSGFIMCVCFMIFAFFDFVFQAIRN